MILISFPTRSPKPSNPAQDPHPFNAITLWDGGWDRSLDCSSSGRRRGRRRRPWRQREEHFVMGGR